MRKLKQLRPQDVLFVGGETPSVYQHTAGLILVDGSDVPDYGFDTFRRHVEEYTGKIPQFRWKLHEVPLGLDLPYWVEDENFDLDNHIRRIALPSPGDRQALSEVVSYIYCRHLDRKRPLWEVWFIEGLADGSYAFLQKLHHCVMDGQGATRLTEAMWDFEPGGGPKEIDPAITGARPGEVPERWRQSLNTAMHLSRMPLRAGGEIADTIWHRLSRSLSGNGQSRERATAPSTSFNRAISGDRGFVFCSLSLADIKAVKDHFGVTVNDVILAIVSGSLRDYLLARGELPAEPLRTSIAVSLRTDADDEFTNRVTAASVTLATDLADPEQRLSAIAEESVRAKYDARHGGKGVMEILELLPPLLINVMVQLVPADSVAKMAGANVVVSNVRGSEKPMYVAGARAKAIYPMSIISPGGGLNITCLSYSDEVHFGLTIEPSLIPDPWLLVDGLHETLAEYVAKVGRRRKKALAKSKKTRKKRPAPAGKSAAKRPSARKTRASAK